ncbi:hypothetical protein CTRU02_211239 [Colletotrichum truncatum]|uniref:Uncharacterized protein n=1 Tax=Colletotrichum truncatum TaxID=5467 RepID=A0ACC3YRB4_COLTU
MGERTGSRVFQWVWSYVTKRCDKRIFILHTHRLQFQQVT